MPSDTIYGLFCNFSGNGIEKLHAVKQRPADKPFLLVLPANFPLDQIVNMESLKPEALDKLKMLMPGKNTLILPKGKNMFYPDGNTIAVRVPSRKDNEFFFEALNHYNGPLLAPSLNLHGQKPLEDLDDIILNFGEKVDAIFFDADFVPGTASELWDLTVTPFQKLR